ncbi:hypothetical protein KSP40_PGU015908 [Platanthera guangdongensis]|uniref:GDSL esterase/lipase n=1 Tax=Platanthera guangdongensis TaxID=2320717 RepID=A0ABR2MRJ9_9ASPA
MTSTLKPPAACRLAGSQMAGPSPISLVRATANISSCLLVNLRSRLYELLDAGLCSQHALLRACKIEARERVNRAIFFITIGSNDFLNNYLTFISDFEPPDTFINRLVIALKAQLTCARDQSVHGSRRELRCTRTRQISRTARTVTLANSIPTSCESSENESVASSSLVARQENSISKSILPCRASGIALRASLLLPPSSSIKKTTSLSIDTQYSFVTVSGSLY